MIATQPTRSHPSCQLGWLSGNHRHGLPLRVRAPHRLLQCMANLLCMGLSLWFRCCPSPGPFTLLTMACLPA